MRLTVFLCSTLVMSLIGILPASVAAQESDSTAPFMAPDSPDEHFEKLSNALDEQAKQIEELKAQLADMKKDSQLKTRTESKGCGIDSVFKQVPVIAEKEQDTDCGSEADTKPLQLRFLAEYNKGFQISPVDPKADPFQIKVNGWTQFRHVGFSRDVDSWTDNAGVTRQVRSRNNFDIERARLVFSGYAVDPRSTFFIQLDGDTDGREAVDFFDFWWAWKFSDALRVQIGKRKVSASRRWLLGARDSRFADRPLATDFFRPDRTTGIWATGKLGDDLHYELTLGNGYRTANRNAAEIDDQLIYSATSWWDANGPFGKTLTDHAVSEDFLVRVGHSFNYAPNTSDTFGTPLRETGFLRLSDGTVLTNPNALGAGSQVSEFDSLFYAVDVGTKYQGWSFSSEFYFRWLRNIQGTGPISTDSLYQYGYFLEGGQAIIPNILDWNVRYSRVSGDFGSANEYSAGINWYPLDSTKWKITFDVSKFDGSPLNNTASEILAGDDGTLFRTQFQAEF